MSIYVVAAESVYCIRLAFRRQWSKQQIIRQATMFWNTAWMSSAMSVIYMVSTVYKTMNISEGQKVRKQNILWVFIKHRYLKYLSRQSHPHWEHSESRSQTFFFPMTDDPHMHVHASQHSQHSLTPLSSFSGSQRWYFPLLLWRATSAHSPSSGGNKLMSFTW